MENSNKMKIWFFENVNQRRSIIQSDQEKKKCGFVEKNQNNKIKTKMEKSQHTTQKQKGHKRLL